MNIPTPYFLLVSLTALVSAQTCGSQTKLKACACKTKVGYIRSPDVIGSRNCQWPIYASRTDHVVVLESANIEISSTSNCYSGFLEIFDGPDNTSRPLGRWCNGSMSVESSGRDLLVVYRSDEFDKISNFTLTYKAKATGSDIGVILAFIIPAGIIFLIIIISAIVGFCKGESSGWRISVGFGVSGGFGDGGGGGGGGC